jgi:hypothetical protein
MLHFVPLPHHLRLYDLSNYFNKRLFSSEAPAAAAVAATPKPSRGGGTGLVQRITSFLVGAGVTALVTQYYIFEEVKEGNKSMLAKQKELELRIAKLEKK